MEGNNEQDIAIVIPYRWEVEQLNKYLESKKLKTICVNTRNEKVKFDRLLRLKKTFIPELMNTSKERTFK